MHVRVMKKAVHGRGLKLKFFGRHNRCNITHINHIWKMLKKSDRLSKGETV